MDFVSDPSNKPSGVEKPVRIEAGFQILHDGKALSGFPHTSIRFFAGREDFLMVMIPSRASTHFLISWRVWTNLSTFIYGLIMYNPRFLVKRNHFKFPFPLLV